MKLINFYHLTEVEESYLEHLEFSLWAGFFLCYLGMISLLHAVFPFFLSRYPDKLFRHFVDKSFSRRNRVDKILQEKNLE